MPEIERYVDSDIAKIDTFVTVHRFWKSGRLSCNPGRIRATQGRLMPVAFDNALSDKNKMFFFSVDDSGMTAHDNERVTQLLDGGEKR